MGTLTALSAVALLSARQQIGLLDKSRLVRDVELYVLSPVVLGRKGEYVKLFEDLRKEGFSRVRVDGVA